MNFIDSFRIKRAARIMAERGLFPKFSEIIPTNFGFFSHLYDGNIDQIISEEVATGFGPSPESALIRSISEYVERKAFREGKANLDNACLTARSDGFAAFPKIISSFSNSYENARKNALNEAIERFSWATWFDNKEISHHIYDVNFLRKSWKHFDSALANMEFHENVIDVKVVLPSIKHNNVSLIILIVFTADGGAISGGAAGGNSSQEKSSTIVRATSELFRHALALNRLKQTGIAAKGFYQRRLEFFGLKRGGEIVRQRLSERGNDSICLPKLSIDCQISHALQDIFQVHRCFFENQPPFIGGQVERFCI